MGSIYLHCDDDGGNSYLRLLMDAVFGRGRRFRNEISWQRNDGRGKGSQHQAKTWGRNTDTLLFYARTSAGRVRPLRALTEEEGAKRFTKTDARGRYYTGIPLYCSPSMAPRPNLCYEWRGFRNPHPSGWRLSRERLEEEYQRGNVVIRDDGKLERRKYEADYAGAPMDDFWSDIPRITNKGEATGWPTQKPLKLYERIIKASSNEGGMGCGG